MKKILLLFSLLLLLSCNNKPSSTDAYIMNKQLVESHLSGKIFEIDFPFSDFRADDLKNGAFLIESSFEGKNDYGVMVKVKYRSKLQYKGEGDNHDVQNWELLDFTVLE
jgi:hypothetical protein